MATEIIIGVVSTFDGFKQFMADNSTYTDPRLPYVIKFKGIFHAQQLRGSFYNSYIVHCSAHINMDNQDRIDILKYLPSRIITIK